MRLPNHSIKILWAVLSGGNNKIIHSRCAIYVYECFGWLIGTGLFYTTGRNLFKAICIPLLDVFQRVVLG